ncbi:MAG: hypothetical protein JWQ87_731 [Candidatus Sulfotelmatobacter sp.]|nr:hypothetical protein [Candidatus Sulfotelmatobacter sp.]
MWWPGTELNRRRQPFQGCALPPELPGHVFETRRGNAGCEDCSPDTDCCRIANRTNCVVEPVRTILIIAMAASSLNLGNRRGRDCSSLETIKMQGIAEGQPEDTGSPPECVCRARYASYCPPAVELCCPSQDASCGSCCDFRSTQLLMRSTDCLYVRSAASILCAA